MTDNDTIKHWTITTTLERTFTGTQKEAEQLQQEEREYYDSLTDGGDVCGYVTGSHLDCDGVPTDDDKNRAAFAAVKWGDCKYDNDWLNLTYTAPSEPDIETD
jgi:hypothetical protein